MLNSEDKGSPMTAPMEKEGRNEATQRATFIPPRLSLCVRSYKGFLCLPYCYYSVKTVRTRRQSYFTLSRTSERAHMFTHHFHLHHRWYSSLSVSGLLFTVLENMILLLKTFTDAVFLPWRRLLTSRSFEDKWNGASQIYSTIGRNCTSVIWSVIRLFHASF